jgi:hypothetical protein
VTNIIFITILILFLISQIFYVVENIRIAKKQYKRDSERFKERMAQLNHQHDLRIILLKCKIDDLKDGE